MNSPERGDTRPCSQTGCAGVMQFAREPLRTHDGVALAQGPLTWICRSEPQHGTANWDDDGGKHRC